VIRVRRRVRRVPRSRCERKEERERESSTGESLGSRESLTSRPRNDLSRRLFSAQKTKYDNTGGVEEQLPPPPSPPQLKEAQPDGVSRPNSVDRVLHPDGSQHVSHETLNKVRYAKLIPRRAGGKLMNPAEGDLNSTRAEERGIG